MKSLVSTLGRSSSLAVRAQRGPQTGEELVHSERLRDVVVGAGVERDHLVRLAAARREDDDRRLAPSTQALDHLDPVHVGEAEVEDDGVAAARSSGGVSAERPSSASVTS